MRRLLATWTSAHTAVIVLAVLTALGAATLIDLFDGPGTERQERIARTAPPLVSLNAFKAFPGYARRYVKERYALKDTFVAMHGAVKLGLFGRSPTPRVLLGQEDFLFLNDDGAVSLAQGGRLEQPDVDQKWGRHFSRLREAFDARGVKFIFVLAPNKHSVYPDKLPQWIEPRPDGPNATDQILALAGDRLDPAPVDLRAVLNAQRAAGETPLYYHTDTHWNELGAAVSLRAALASGDLPLPPLKASIGSTGMGGDLARMIGQQSRRDEVNPMVARDGGSRCTTHLGEPLSLTALDPLPQRRFTCTREGGRRGVAVVFTDSFGAGAAPTLSQVFETTHFIWQDAIDMRMVDALSPDAVFQIMVERKVWTVDPDTLLLGYWP